MCLALQHPCKSSGIATYVCDSSSGEAETGIPKLSGPQAWLQWMTSRLSERLCLKERRRATGEGTVVNHSPPHTRTTYT